MKAIRVISFGGPEVLNYRDLEEPQVGAEEVKIKLHAAGLNPSDAYILTGNYSF